MPQKNAKNTIKTMKYIVRVEQGVEQLREWSELSSAEQARLADTWNSASMSEAGYSLSQSVHPDVANATVT